MPGFVADGSLHSSNVHRRTVLHVMGVQNMAADFMGEGKGHLLGDAADPSAGQPAATTAETEGPVVGDTLSIIASSSDCNGNRPPLTPQCSLQSDLHRYCRTGWGQIRYDQSSRENRHTPWLLRLYGAGDRRLCRVHLRSSTGHRRRRSGSDRLLAIGMEPVAVFGELLAVLLLSVITKEPDRCPFVGRSAKDFFHALAIGDQVVKVRQSDATFITPERLGSVRGCDGADRRRQVLSEDIDSGRKRHGLT